MALIVPSSVNYPSPLTAIPSRMQDEPVEGRKQIPIEIDWGVMGGAANCVSFNFQNNATLNVSQIATMKIDNSASGADVTFIFTDTGETITIPAGSPLVVVPVFSNSTSFFASAPKGKTGDITRAQVLNYPNYPADVPETTESQIASSGGTVIVGGGGGPVQLVPAGINGTLETLKLMISNPAGGASQSSISVIDGAGGVFINAWNVGLPAIAFASQTPMDFNNANWRFTNGLSMTFGAAGGAGSFIANTFVDYHQP